MCVLVSWNVLDSDEVHGDVVQCFTGVQFNHVQFNYIALYHSVFEPLRQLCLGITLMFTHWL